MKETTNLLDAIKPYVSMATLIALIGFIIYMSRWVEHIENKVQANETNIQKHFFDTDEHMPLKEKIEVFVPRVEIDQRLKNLEAKTNLIDSKIDKLIERQQ